jgi:hypothetical protein
VLFTHKKRKIMKATFRRKVLTGAGVLALAGGTILATGGSALATPAPYFPDAGATLGGVDFFNSAGVQIFSGSSSAQPFIGTGGYAVAQNNPGGVKAAYYAYTPVNGSPPGSWGGAQLSGATNYPLTSPPAPADLAGLTNPIVSAGASDVAIDTYAITGGNTATDSYKGLYEIRVKVTGAAGYAATDIFVDPVAHTWTQVDGTFQLFPDTSSTTLVVAPPSPAATGTVETLTATVADTTAGSTNTPAGTVQFMDGANPIGSPVTVSGGTAHTTTTLVPAVHSLTAVFTSSAPAVVAGSTSVAVPYTVANLDVTNTALSVTPGSGNAFDPQDLKATVTDTTTPASHPTGTVQFLDGATPLGGPVAVSATTGVAEIPAYTGLGQGAHSITAVYTPTVGTLFAGSTSAAVPFSLAAPACPQGEAVTLCTDTQSVDAVIQAGTITITTPYNGVGANGTLHLGNLQLNTAGTLFTASAPFGDGTSTGGIFVTSTQAGNPNWTASVQAGTFTNNNGLGDTIDGQYAGLTNVTVKPVLGNALQAAAGSPPAGNGVYTTDNPAGTSALALGTNGIGGAKHAFAHTVGGGDGSVGFTGTLTLNAPTSKTAGTYIGTVTFTVG